MPTIHEIADLSAPELSAYTQLTRAQLANPQHPEQGLFIAESAKVIEAALHAGCVPVSLLMEREKTLALADTLLARVGDVPVYTAQRETLSQLTGYALTRGVLCAMRRPKPAQMDDVCRSARRIAVLEGVVDTTNMGAIFRAAASLGMDAVLLTPTCCDPLSRRALRVSMGTVFKVPWAFIPRGVWPQEGVSRLKALGFSLAAMALDSRAISVDDPALKAKQKLAVVLGTEGDGLCAQTISLCDHTVMIPMSHGVDSLNVAAASAVAFWELGKAP